MSDEVKVENKNFTEVELKKLLEQQRKEILEEITRVAKDPSKLKPWEVELLKINDVNIDTPYGKKCMSESLNAFMSEQSKR